LEQNHFLRSYARNPEILIKKRTPGQRPAITL